VARKNGGLRGRYRVPAGNATKGIYDVTDVLLASTLSTWASKTTKVDILLIAGGGGGAMVENGGGAGGGGAGGVLYGTNITLISGNVSIGAGGAGSLSSGAGYFPTSGRPIGSYGTRGANTVLTLTAKISGVANLVSNTYIAYGGGAAQSNITDHNKGGSGASSGLAYQDSQSGLQGSFTGYGNDGGSASGGGANTAGSSYTGGTGKLFVDFTMVGSNSAKGNTGTLGYVAGGGSGSSQSNNNDGAVGGGGNGYEAYTSSPANWPAGLNGWVNSGGGGGGSGGPGWYSTNGGNGGSGVLVIRIVPGNPILGNTTGSPDIVSAGGTTFYVFKNSGSFSV
jgi:hypothetical protein